MAQTPSALGYRALRAYEQLARIGSRRTVARQLVLSALDEGGGHRSASEIHARVSRQAPTLTLSTIYRTLTTLAKLGIVHALDYDGETHYGFADAPHHHSICTRCGVTTEISPAALADVVDRLQELAGLTLADDGMTLRGICPACLAKERSRRRARPSAR